MLQTKFPGDPRQEGVTVERRTFKQQGKTSTRVLASLICPFLRPVSGRLVPAADGGELRLNVSIRHHRRLERITFVYSESDWEDVTTRQLHLAKRGRGTGAEYFFNFDFHLLSQDTDQCVKFCTFYLLKAHTSAFTIQDYRI